MWTTLGKCPMGGLKPSLFRVQEEWGGLRGDADFTKINCTNSCTQLLAAGSGSWYSAHCLANVSLPCCKEYVFILRVPQMLLISETLKIEFLVRRNSELLCTAIMLSMLSSTRTE